MKIVVCMRPVPDPASRLFINDDKTWIKVQDLTFVASEADTHAMEEALRIREAGFSDAEIVVLSVGQDPAVRVLRFGLAVGADRAIQVGDPRLDGGDELGTARAIAAAIEKDGGADLVLTGVQSDDLGGGMTGIMVAELLGWPHASVVVDVGLDGGRVRAVREREAGKSETLEMPLPAVLTIQFGVNQPRYASLKGIMAAKKKELKAWSIEDLGLDPDEAGRKGARAVVRDVFVPSSDHEVEIFSGTPVEAATQLVERLRKETGLV